MIPILTLSEIKDVERNSSQQHGLTEFDMIMSAGEAVFQSIKVMIEQAEEDDFAESFPPHHDEGRAHEHEQDNEDPRDTRPVVAFVCGKGHNGADALSAALLSAQVGYGVVIYQLHADRYSPEIQRLHKQLADTDLKLHLIRSAVDLPVFHNVDLVVDGILGSGIQDEPRDLLPSLIHGINRSGLPVLSIDVPSGVNCDSNAVKGSAVKASTTLCLGAMKLSAAFFPASSSYGKVDYSPICFDEKLLVNQPSRMEMYTEDDALDNLPSKNYRSTKYSSGKVLILSGCRGMHGAAALAANAALRAGAGLVRAVVPAGIYGDISAHLLEVIGTPVGSDDDYCFTPDHIPQIQPWIEWADSILIGPGLGRDPRTAKFMDLVMPLLNGRRVVVDGDGLAYFDPAFPERRQGKGLEQFVVTPHAGEYKRMGGRYDYDAPLKLLDDLRTFSQSGSIGMVLKGPTTIFAGPDGKHIIIPAGNPGMATAGTGDVLAGILAAFLTRHSREEAAPLAVFLHGRSGDAARRDRGTLGMAASDLILYLPLAIKELEDLLLEFEDDDEEDI